MFEWKSQRRYFNWFNYSIKTSTGNFYFQQCSQVSLKTILRFSDRRNQLYDPQSYLAEQRTWLTFFQKLNSDGSVGKRNEQKKKLRNILKLRKNLYEAIQEVPCVFFNIFCLVPLKQTYMIRDPKSFCFLKMLHLNHKRPID